MHSRPWRRARPALLLVAAGGVHRLVVFLAYREDLTHLVEANPDTLTWQLPTLSALQGQLGPTLLAWQQTPPLPVLVFGALVKLFAWPGGVAAACIALHQALSIGAAALLFQLLRRLTGWTAASFAIAATWLLGVDQVVLEYNAFGQTFYDTATAVLLLGAVLAFLRLQERRRLADALWLGVCCALLALCRAPYWAWFGLPLLLWPRGAGSGRHALAFGAVLLALQGGWVAKNLAVHGRFDPSASSWVGSNFAHGLAAAGQGGAFRDFILSESERHPAWFVRLVRRRGADGFPYQWYRWPQAELPPRIARADARRDRAQGGASRGSNSLAQAEASDHFLSAYRRYAARHPAAVARKLADSYRLFWQPIRNYGIQFVDLLYVVPVIESPFRPQRAWAALLAGKLPEPQRVMTGRFRPDGPKTGRPTRIPAAALLPLLLLLLEVGALHLLTPLALGVAIRRRRADGGRDLRLHLLLVASFAYAALVLCVAEHGENMRFRATVEPLLLALAAWNAKLVWQALGRARPGAAAPGSAGAIC